MSGAQTLFENTYPHVQIIWIIALFLTAIALIGGLSWLVIRFLRYLSDRRGLPDDTLFAVRRKGDHLELTLHKDAPVNFTQVENLMLNFHPAVDTDIVNDPE